MSIEGSGPVPPKQEIISNKDTEPKNPRVTKVKQWRRNMAVALTAAAVVAGGISLRALAGGGDTEVRPSTVTAQSTETEQTPTLENLIGETQTDLANKSIDLLKKYPEDAKKTPDGFTVKITSGASATGEKTMYGLEVKGEEKSGSYDQSDISSVNFTIINSQNAPESEKLLYSLASDTPEGQITFAYSDFNKLPFYKNMDNTFRGRTAVEKMQKQIGTLFTAASEKQELPKVERPY